MTEDPAQPVGAMPAMVDSAAPVSSDPLGPIREGERLITLDALRGIALLGIFVVNIQFFAMPFMQAWIDPALADGPLTERLAWAFTKIFCEMKFISMFSLLFGAGLVVQMTRAAAKGREFAPVYLRRILVLALFGIAHWGFFWYGDILFLYALLGVLLLFLGRLRPRTMILIAGILILSSAVIGSGCAAIQAWGESMRQAQIAAEADAEDYEGEAIVLEDVDEPDPAEAEETSAEDGAAEDDGREAPVETGLEEPAEAAGAVTEEVLDVTVPAPELTSPEEGEESPRGFDAMMAAQFNPAEEAWADGERQAYKHGPFLDALVFRIVTYIYAFLGAFFGYGWHVMAMFLIGAAMMKSGFFLPEKRRWHARLLVAGLVIGLPLELVVASIHYLTDFQPGWLLPAAGFLHELGATALCLGYVGGICLLATTGGIQSLLRPFTSAGRLALSVYLMETLIASILMYWWGLGWFGDVSRAGQIGIVLLVYVCLIILSTIWLRLFTIGPFEWLWRSLTYLRPQPILRRIRD